MTDGLAASSVPGRKLFLQDMPALRAGGETQQVGFPSAESISIIAAGRMNPEPFEGVDCDADY